MVLTMREEDCPALLEAGAQYIVKHTRKVAKLYHENDFIVTDCTLSSLNHTRSETHMEMIKLF